MQIFIRNGRAGVATAKMLFPLWTRLKLAAAIAADAYCDCLFYIHIHYVQVPIDSPRSDDGFKPKSYEFQLPTYSQTSILGNS